MTDIEPLQRRIAQAPILTKGGSVALAERSAAYTLSPLISGSREIDVGTADVAEAAGYRALQYAAAPHSQGCAARLGKGVALTSAGWGRRRRGRGSAIPQVLGLLVSARCRPPAPSFLGFNSTPFLGQP
ncbi:hypothetical protein C3941_15195 [Kaistia algarum]|nr:hypothetical protein C3941_15195 [Kaistia algarum]